MDSVLGGLFIYWRDWHVYPSFGDWVTSTFGETLTVGALCAIAAMGFGVFVTRPNVGRLLALGRQVAESGAPPTPEVGAEIGGHPATVEAGRAGQPRVADRRGGRDVLGTLPVGQRCSASHAAVVLGDARLDKRPDGAFGTGTSS